MNTLCNRARRTAVAAVLTIVLTTLAAVGLATSPAGAVAPAGASTHTRAVPPGGDWQVDDSLWAQASWSLVGRQKGLPGNYHSGFLRIISQDGDIDGDVHDYACPARVLPPGATGPTDGSACTEVRSRSYDGYNLLHPWPTYTGPIAATVGPEFEFYYPTPILDPVTDTYTYNYFVPASLSFRPVGPVSITRYGDWSGDSVAIVPSADLRLTGHLGRLRFDDPRMHVDIQRFDRETDYTRITG